jgi:hypothetical protein
MDHLPSGKGLFYWSWMWKLFTSTSETSSRIKISAYIGVFAVFSSEPLAALASSLY